MNLEKLFIELGYTAEEYQKIRNNYSVVRTTDEVFYNNVVKIHKRFLNLIYSLNEVKKITVTFPQVYSLSVDNLTPKIEFYDSIELHNMVVKDPRNLMQSVNVSYARYNFLKEKGIKITMVNYKKIFVAHKQFEAQYKITKETLFKKYNYEESKKTY